MSRSRFSRVIDPIAGSDPRIRATQEMNDVMVPRAVLQQVPFHLIVFRIGVLDSE